MQTKIATRRSLWIALLCLPLAAAAQTRPSADIRYDANGNVTWTKDALGRITTQRFDSYDALTAISMPRPFPEDERPRVRFRYDGQGQSTAVIDARGLATRYVVDGLGNTTRQDSPDSGVTRYTYDAAGNVLTSRDARGKLTNFGYDPLNRLTRIEYANDDVTQFQYDQGPNAIGRITRMTDPGPITTTWGYNTQGRVAMKQQVVEVGGVERAHAVLYGYGATSNLLESTTYPSGRVVSYVYGASRRIESVSLDGMPIVSGVKYHPSGEPISLQYGNGNAWSQTFDIDGRPSSYTLGGVQYSIEWDRGNRIRAIWHATTPFWSAEFRYDGLDRITSFNSEPRSQTFRYDDSGNLLTKTDRTGTSDPVSIEYTIDPASNRMQGIASLGIGYTIDNAGNRTSDNTTTWVVDPRGRVRQVKIIDGAITRAVNYAINGQDLRVLKRGPAVLVPQGARIFVYDEVARLIGEYDNLGRARVEHVWLDDRPVAFVVYEYAGTSLTPQKQELFYVESDHLRTPRFVTDSSRVLRWHWSSAPYGDTLPNDNPSGKGTLTYNVRFAGQYFDTETSLFYNWHRDYESTTGRYIQSDPIGMAGGLNTYSYVDGNPINMVDPLGLAGCFVNFPDYPITVPGTSWQTTLTPGHAGALGYDNSTGVTRYYEYGRYDSDFGNVRRQPVPDLKIGRDGQPTPESLKALREFLSREAGKATPAELTCEKDIDEKKLYEYAEKLMRDSNRPPYSWKPWASNTCRDFASRALRAGRP